MIKLVRFVEEKFPPIYQQINQPVLSPLEAWDALVQVCLPLLRCNIDLLSLGTHVKDISEIGAIQVTKFTVKKNNIRVSYQLA